LKSSSAGFLAAIAACGLAEPRSCGWLPM
jgi:hypothetical protein